MAFLIRFWKPLAGGFAVIVLLLLYRAQIAAAEDRGHDAATIAAAHAAAAASAAYQQQVNDASAALATARATTRTKGRKVQADVTQFYRENPDAAGVRCLSDERVRQANATRAGLYPAPPGRSGDPVRDHPPARATDG